MTDISDAHTARPELKERRAIVTGGTTGIGRAISVLLASQGARVFICGRNGNHLDDALTRIREVGEADGITADLSKADDMHRFFDRADQWLGGLDIAVINAAIPADATGDTPEDQIRYQLETDLVAYVVAARLSIERMKAGSDIVLIGSMSAVSRGPGSSIYVAAKAGVEGFAQSLRKELGEKDIKLGLIVPGLVGSDFQYPEIPPEKQRELIEERRMLRAEDIAVATDFMLRQPRRCAVSMMRVETLRDHP